jgi:hypothetical protein
MHMLQKECSSLVETMGGANQTSKKNIENTREIPPLCAEPKEEK